MVSRASFVKHSPDPAKVLVDEIRGETGWSGVWRTVGVRLITDRRPDVSEDIHFGPEVPGSRLGRDDEIRVIHPEWLMDAMRTHVGDHCSEGRCELLLHIEIPLHH